jgi:hypothetical protein
MHATTDLWAKVAFDEGYAPVSMRDFDLRHLESSQIPLTHAGAQPESSASS